MASKLIKLVGIASLTLSTSSFGFSFISCEPYERCGGGDWVTGILFLAFLAYWAIKSPKQTLIILAYLLFIIGLPIFSAYIFSEIFGTGLPSAIGLIGGGYISYKIFINKLISDQTNKNSFKNSNSGTEEISKNQISKIDVITPNTLLSNEPIHSKQLSPQESNNEKIEEPQSFRAKQPNVSPPSKAPLNYPLGKLSTPLSERTNPNIQQFKMPTQGSRDSAQKPMTAKAQLIIDTPPSVKPTISGEELERYRSLSINCPECNKSLTPHELIQSPSSLGGGWKKCPNCNMNFQVN